MDENEVRRIARQEMVDMIPFSFSKRLIFWLTFGLSAGTLMVLILTAWAVWRSLSSK